MAVVVDGVVLAAVGHGDYVDVMDEKVHRDGQATSLGKTRFELGRGAWCRGPVKWAGLWLGEWSAWPIRKPT